VLADEIALDTAGTVENKALFFLAASALRERRVTPLETSIVDGVDDGSENGLLATSGVYFRLELNIYLYLGKFGFIDTC
jgi:hypothetical protein